MRSISGGKALKSRSFGERAKFARFSFAHNEELSVHLVMNMPIKPEETDITGQWILVNGKITGDEAENRIDVLIHGELEKVGRDASGWEILYRDPSDGRLWELTFPKGEMQGGGPKRLHLLDPAEASRKYEFSR